MVFATFFLFFQRVSILDILKVAFYYFWENEKYGESFALHFAECFANICGHVLTFPKPNKLFMVQLINVFALLAGPPLPSSAPRKAVALEREHGETESHRVERAGGLPRRCLRQKRVQITAREP